MVMNYYTSLSVFLPMLYNFIAVLILLITVSKSSGEVRKKYFEERITGLPLTHTDVRL